MEFSGLRHKKPKENSLENVKWSQFNITMPFNGKYLLYNTLSGNLILSTSCFDELPIRYSQDIPIDEQHQTLLKLGFLVPSTVNELAISRYQLEKRKTKLSQGLTILPTEKCNFRCVYCYEEFTKGRMTSEIQAGLIKWAHSNIRYWKELTVSWFGGEPLIAIDIVERLSTELMDLCVKNDVSYLAVMTTNGYLLDINRVHRLFNLGVQSYQITLDGPEKQHDHNRKLVNGEGTFQTIQKNIADIAKTDLPVKVTIRINIDKDNVNFIKTMLDSLITIIGDDMRFKFRIFPVGRWGGLQDESLPVLEDKADFYLRNCIEYAIDRGLLSGIDEFFQPNLICYAALPNHFVIGSDGTIYKCTVALDNPANRVGRLLPSGQVVIDDQLMALWVANDGENDSICGRCKVYPVCHGAACPLIRIESNTKPCHPIKENTGEWIRLLAKEASSRAK